MKIQSILSVGAGLLLLMASVTGCNREESKNPSADAASVAASTGTSVHTAPAADEPVVEITGGTVNVRKGPETGYGVVTIARDGERYPHIATARNGWHCIAIGDGTAWVSGKYSNVRITR